MKTAENMTGEEKRNAAALIQLNDYVNTEQYGLMDALFAVDYRDHNPGWNIASVDDLKQVIAAGHRDFDVHNELEWIIPSGDMVFLQVQNKGRHNSEVFGCPATGKETNMTTFEIYRFNPDGKIAERWVLSDIIGLMKQLGAALPAGV